MWNNNGNNKMPDRLCIRNGDGNSTSIEYDAQKWLYENLFKDSFFKHLPTDVKDRCKGNHGFKIAVPHSVVYHDKNYTIRGFKNAVMFAHVLMLATACPVTIKDINDHNIVSIYILDGYYMNHYLGKEDAKCLLTLAPPSAKR